LFIYTKFQIILGDLLGEFIEVGNVNDFSDGQGKVVEVKGKPIALFKLGEEIFAFDNTCRHDGGPLGEGSLEGDVVTCPWHGWQYNIKTGANKTMPNMDVAKYEVKIENEKVLISVD